ncbi:MAG: F0F1 ATP synthase subunit epsilon [Hylemonella sp.]
MQLKVLLPTQVLVDEPVTRVVAEALNGSFCLLPRHVDFVSALACGILAYTTDRGDERFLAVDEGTLVKVGPQVLVSTRQAVAHPSLEALRDTIAEQFRQLDEQERQSRSALARLEAAALQHFLELEERQHG